MKKANLNKLNTHSTNTRAAEDSLQVCPKDYRGLKDISDQYDLTAKMLHQGNRNPGLARLISQHINGEDLNVYGPATNYKSKYSYNRDN